jgi:hypothetical protein
VPGTLATPLRELDDSVAIGDRAAASADPNLGAAAGFVLEGALDEAVLVSPRRRGTRDTHDRSTSDGHRGDSAGVCSRTVNGFTQCQRALDLAAIRNDTDTVARFANIGDVP